MGYTHYGKQAEVWKHLPLSDIIATEQPSVYVETNSAYADYTLCQSAEQQYGIYLFLRKATQHPVRESRYHQLEQKAIQENRYIGSPGLALSILKEKARYVFFDLDEEALHNIELFSRRLRLSDCIELRHRESIAGMRKLLPLLPQTSFIHIDPYTIHEPNAEGYTYLDIFREATLRGLKCFLWYGYQTLDEKEMLEHLIKECCKENSGAFFSCHQLTLKIIERDTLPCTPGVLGSGLLTSNLSAASRACINTYCDLLVDFYDGATYNEYNGELYKDVLI